MSTSFNLSEAPERINQDNSNNKMNSLLACPTGDQTSYSLFHSMVAASMNKPLMGSQNFLLQSGSFNSHPHSNFKQPTPHQNLEDPHAGLINLFGELPADAFEPVPIGQSNTRMPAPPLNASILESVLDHALGVVQEPDHFTSAATSVTNIRKRAPSPSYPETTASAPITKRRRVSTNGPQQPRFRGYQETQWMEQFQVLVKFKEDHGNCMVPHTYPENQVLSRWVKRQRYQYKLKMTGKVSTMTDARIQKLEDVGFVWDSHATAWDKRLKELKEYRDIHGDCNVPSNNPENPELATWIKCQRRQYKLYWAGNKSSSMTMDRMHALNELGMIWKVREDLPLPNAAHMF